jgi:Putative adhesin
MPAFDTPEPISLEIDLVVGDVRITAGARDDTTVEVRPTDPGHDQDVRAAEQTRVERTAAGILVRAPRPRTLGLFGKPGSVDVIIGLPAGSQVRGEASVAAFRTTGPLGECRIKTVGAIQLDQVGPAHLRTGAGGIEVTRARGPAEVSTGTGRIALGEVDGPAVVSSSNGEIRIGAVTGDLRVRSANGTISVGQAAAGVDARTANGEIRIGEVISGLAVLRTSSGEIEVGVSAGTAARLDLYTQHGRVLNELTEADGPGAGDQVAELQARTSYGDIVIRRSQQQ